MANCHHTCHTCEAWADHGAIRTRFERWVDRAAGPDGCWPWTGSRNEKGYGRINIGRLPDYAHRVSVRLFGRDIPDGMQVDHLCRNTSCVNPAHLEVVTQKENIKRQAPRPGASGVLGVTWHKGKQRWRVVIAGKQVGEYRTFAEASAVAKAVTS